MLELGFASIDITPTCPVDLIGFSNRRSSQGVAQPLIAQVAVLRMDGFSCLLAAIDHIGFGIEHALRLRQNLGKLIGVEAEQVMLCFSHTHAAPNDSAEPEWADWADTRILSAARRALGDMRPVLAGWSCADVNIGVNRRSTDGALDRRAGMLKFTDADTGAPMLAVMRLTAHGNSLKSDNSFISPDWFGSARDLLTREWDCPVIITQGAAGNIAPRFFDSQINPPDADDSGRFTRTRDALSEMARAVLAGANDAFHAIQPQDVYRLNMYVRRGELWADVPDMRRAHEIADEARVKAGIDGTRWLAEVERLNAQGILRQREYASMQFLRLNEGALIGIPNEVMCELALAVQACAGRLAFLGGYTNGCMGYLPTAEEYDRGGYEVLWSMLNYFMYFGRVMPLNRDTADMLVDMAVDGLND